MKQTYFKKGTFRLRVWAILTAIVMVLSLIMPTGMSKVEAAPQGYSVSINLYDYDKQTQADPEQALLPKNTAAPFYVVAVAKGGTPEDPWTCYAVKKVSKLEKKNTLVSFDRTDFRIDVYNQGNFARNDYNYSYQYYNYIGHYDPTKYKMESVTLYRAKDGLREDQVKIGGLYSGQDISYEDMVAQLDMYDAAPYGYKFLGSSASTDPGVIELYRSDYKAQYELRLTVEGDGKAISEDDGYYALVDVLHSNNDHTYFVGKLSTDGTEGTKTYTVDKWLNSSGGAAAD